jgi:hypothetical protein
MSAFYAMVWRLAKTSHEIVRELPSFEGGLRVGGNFPQKRKKYFMK